MIIRRIHDRITKGRLLTPEELKIYHENQKLSAYMYHELYLNNILEQYSVTRNLEEPLLNKVKYELAKLIDKDISVIGSEELEITLQNIVLDLLEK